MPGSRVEGDMTGQDPRAALQHMCETNAALQDSGGDVWQWMAGLYGRDAVMAIRRERDGQAGVLNLFDLLHDMEAYSHILTRARHRGSLAELPQFPTRLIDEQFEQCGGLPSPGRQTTTSQRPRLRKTGRTCSMRPAIEERGLPPDVPLVDPRARPERAAGGRRVRPRPDPCPA